MNNDTAGPAVMDKDFNGAGWASKYDSSFKKLIADAKKKAQSQKSPTENVEGQGSEGVEPEPRIGNGTAFEKRG